ncbi:hypothetical protein VNO78_16472 [Psophocarpus tetragonolobus]|uniref:Uncharacterized protein n=1 Tax=Psophocarpus tetragonolobus TaxID=3891 RepID=A0AAN9XK57_PSOTE
METIWRPSSAAVTNTTFGCGERNVSGDSHSVLLLCLHAWIKFMRRDSDYKYAPLCVFQTQTLGEIEGWCEVRKRRRGSSRAGSQPKEMAWSNRVKQENLRINKEVLTESRKGENMEKQSYANVVRLSKGAIRINVARGEGTVDEREKEVGNRKCLCSSSSSCNEEEDDDDSMEMEQRLEALRKHACKRCRESNPFRHGLDAFEKVQNEVSLSPLVEEVTKKQLSMENLGNDSTLTKSFDSKIWSYVGCQRVTGEEDKSHRLVNVWKKARWRIFNSSDLARVARKVWSSNLSNGGDVRKHSIEVDAEDSVRV